MRFVFGGLMTVITGLLAKRYGPGVAGLFPGLSGHLPSWGDTNRET